MEEGEEAAGRGRRWWGKQGPERQQQSSSPHWARFSVQIGQEEEEQEVEVVVEVVVEEGRPWQ